MEGSEGEAIFDSLNLNPQLFINATLNIINELIDSAFDHLSEAYAQLKIHDSDRPVQDLTKPMATVDINEPSICNSEHYGDTIHTPNADTSSNWQSGSGNRQSAASISACSTHGLPNINTPPRLLQMLRLCNALKSKHEENEAYLSEIETIGQACYDVQAQNQHLLQQAT